MLVFRIIVLLMIASCFLSSLLGADRIFCKNLCRIAEKFAPRNTNHLNHCSKAILHDKKWQIIDFPSLQTAQKYFNQYFKPILQSKTSKEILENFLTYKNPQGYPILFSNVIFQHVRRQFFSRLTFVRRVQNVSVFVVSVSLAEWFQGQLLVCLSVPVFLANDKPANQWMNDPNQWMNDRVKNCKNSSIQSGKWPEISIS